MLDPTNQDLDSRLRTAIEAATSGILMTDAQGRIVLVNRQVETLFGYRREELLGQAVEILVPEVERAAHARWRADFLRDPRVRRMGTKRDLMGRRRDGTQVPLEIGLTPVIESGGIFVLATITDISAHKRAEERFRIAVESSPNGMLMVDREGRVMLVNREIERMFGWTREELLGQPVERLVPERFRPPHPAQREAFFRAPHVRAMGAGRELFGVRKDGSEFPVEIGLNPIQTEEGLFVLGSVLDISARRRAEQERRRLEDQLRQAQKMEAIGRLASGIAHDFNNLLMGIIGCGGLARRELPPEHPASTLLGDICDAAQRGTSLTRDLLDLSRRKKLDVVASELNSVVRVAERMLRQVIGEDIAFEVVLCPSGGPILANPTHVEHILLNLAVNARDAMPSGGRLRIATLDQEFREPRPARGRVLPAGRYVTLEVEDSGTGMDAETLARVFEPFFTTKPVGTGTGLGLYTVFSIVEQLEGGIELESTLGEGTRFRVHFPHHEAFVSQAAPSAPATALEIAPPLPGPRGGRILLVEDERLIRVTLRQMLAGMGFEVLVAQDAASAFQCSRAFRGSIDLLLSDIVLPDASGSEIARMPGGERPGMRVLFMSAYPSDLLAQQGRVASGTKTLEKPFTDETLARALREALAGDPAHS